MNINMYIEMCKWVDLATTIQNLHIYTYSNVNAHLLKKINVYCYLW